MDRKTLVFIIIPLIITSFFIWIFGGLIKFYWPGQKEKAIEIAQTYLQKKFKQQMIYMTVRTSFEPQIYKVYFYPENNTDLKFCVKVLPDLSVFSDNYYKRYFEQEMTKVFKEDIKAIWGGNASMNTYMSTMPISNYNIPNLNEQTKLDDIKQFLRNYYFSVHTAKVFHPKGKKEEAERIFEMIQIVKDSTYQPDRILFWYFESEKDKKESNFCFDNYNGITDVEQVIEFLDANWTI